MKADNRLACFSFSFYRGTFLDGPSNCSCVSKMSRVQGRMLS